MSQKQPISAGADDGILQPNQWKVETKRLVKTVVVCVWGCVL